MLDFLDWVVPICGLVAGIALLALSRRVSEMPHWVFVVLLILMAVGAAYAILMMCR